LLVSNVQVICDTIIPARSEMAIQAKLCNNTSGICGITGTKMNHKMPENILVASTLCEPDGLNRILVHCCNILEDEIILRAGTVFADFISLSKDDQLMNTKTGHIMKPQNTMGEEANPVNMGDVLSQNENIEGQSECIPSKLSDHYDSMVPNHMKELCKKTTHEMKSADHKGAIVNLLTKYSDVFSQGDSDIGQTKLVEHSIPVLEDTKPIKHLPRRLGPEKEKQVEKQVNKLLEQGLIYPGEGAWSHPVVLVRKKTLKPDDAPEWRFCIDYRKLNSVTKKDVYPIPRIDESLDSLAGSEYFSTLDMCSSYWQVPLDKDAQEKSAFITRSGLWNWRVLPFGLTNAPACFERLMEKVLRGLHWKSLLIYLDDVIIFSDTFSNHMSRLEEVFQRFREANLKLKPSKCVLLSDSVKYLGHIVSKDGVSTDPSTTKRYGW